MSSKMIAKNSRPFDPYVYRLLSMRANRKILESFRQTLDTGIILKGFRLHVHASQACLIRRWIWKDVHVFVPCLFRNRSRVNIFNVAPNARNYTRNASIPVPNINLSHWFHEHIPEYMKLHNKYIWNNITNVLFTWVIVQIDAPTGS